jgi:hypothetical protein
MTTALRPDFWPALFDSFERGEISHEVLALVGTVARHGSYTLSRRIVARLLRAGDHQSLRFIRDFATSGWVVEDPPGSRQYHVAEGWCQSAPPTISRRSRTQDRVVPISTTYPPESPEEDDGCPSMPSKWCQSAPPPAEDGSGTATEVVPISTTPSTRAPSTRRIREERRRLRAEGKLPPEPEEDKPSDGEKPFVEETFSPDFEANCKKVRP